MIALLMVIGVTVEAQAQLKGHYLPGFTGMGNGSQPPPSITLAVPIYLQALPIDAIKSRIDR